MYQKDNLCRSDVKSEKTFSKIIFLIFQKLFLKTRFPIIVLNIDPGNLQHSYI